MDHAAASRAVSEAGIIPILIIHDADVGQRAIDALASNGAGFIEIVFRTPAAGPALAAARRRYPSIVFAAGTILDAAGLEAAVDAGADCLISPGLTSRLHELAAAAERPLIPGVMTASEVMQAREWGYRLLKYYPAVPSNGLPVLNDYFNLFPDTQFMATGKISPALVPSFATLPNVSAVGGTWMLETGSLQADRTNFLASKEKLRARTT